MRRFGLFLTFFLLIGTLVLIVLSSGILPYILPIKTTKRLPQPVIPFVSIKEDSETHTISATNNLVIDSRIGNIIVSGGARDVFELTMEKRAQSPNPIRASQLLEEIILTITQEQETTTLHITFPEKAEAEQILADLTILTPQNLNLTVQANLGNFELRELQGNIQAHTSLGDVKLTKFQGNGTLESNLGNIHVVDSSFEKELFALTSLGDLHIQGRLAQTNIFESKLGNVELIIFPKQAYVLKGKLKLGGFTTQVPFVGQQTEKNIQGIIGSGEQLGQIDVALSLGSLKVNSKND